MDRLLELSELIKKSSKIVFFTGAGISTESGIPDFRSANSGLWNDKDMIDFFGLDNFFNKPSDFYSLFIKKFELFLKAQPNTSHYFISKLEEQGKVLSTITQNIDGLHQKSGSNKIIELHGNMNESSCTNCNNRIKTKQVFNMIKKGINPPLCPICKGLIKPDVVFFGENLPAEALENAVERSKDCDLFIVMGSSLVVMPAALMPGYAKTAGADVVILNKMPTSYDSMADIVINDKLGNIVKNLNEMIYE
jgi:NAD-dependent deacetylase